MAGKSVFYFIAMWMLVVGPATASDSDAPGVEKFLGSRTILASLDIGQTRTKLDEDCKNKIDAIVDILKKATPEEKLVRIEGFGERDSQINDPMNLAKKVHDYLRDRHDVRTPMYLTGYNASHGQVVGGKDGYRVDIVSYDTLLPLEEAEISNVFVR